VKSVSPRFRISTITGFDESGPRPRGVEASGDSVMARFLRSCNRESLRDLGVAVWLTKRGRVLLGGSSRKGTKKPNAS